MYEDQKEVDQKDNPFGRDAGLAAVGHSADLVVPDQVEVKRRRKKIWRQLIGIVLAAMIAGTVTLAIVFAWISRDLPSPTKVVRHEGYASRIYDRNGALLFDIYEEAKRMPVSWEELPDYLKLATIAVEDKDFYRHRGFDPLAPFRIVKNYLQTGRVIGASTLTQQLVKNVVLSSERTVMRKVKEFIIAVQVEARYKKDEVLLMYLNESPYGGLAWGVGSAAEQYFGKAVRELNLAECVILAGLPQRPNVYSPFSRTPTAYIDRSQHVAERMLAEGYITSDQEKETLEEIKKYRFYTQGSNLFAPHFVFWVKDQLAQDLGEQLVEQGGLKITTTLDLKLQDEVQKIVAEEIDKAEKLGVSNGASVVLDPNSGQVLAMVGSRGYESSKTDGKFNVVTQGLRQPGSAIKPITYLTAIKKGYTAASLIMDTPVVFPKQAGQTKDYEPKNYTGKFYGPLSLRYALGNSINVTAVKTLAKVKLENMLKQAYSMGISTLEPSQNNLGRFGLAVTLGGAEVRMSELAAAYASFANGGRKIDLTGVLKVEDRSGKTIEEYKYIEGERVMTSQEAFIISNILADNLAREITFGVNSGLLLADYEVAVKTGTTNDKRDNWAIGWTPNLLVAAWVGNNDNSPMTKVASGVSGATPIWRRIMLYELAKRPKQDFPIPDSIVSLEVDRVSGYAAHDGFPSRPEYFIDGTQARSPDPIHLKLKVCRGSSGLAPPEDVVNGNYEEKEYLKFKEDDLVSGDGKNRWQEGIDSWINQQTEKDKYFPPETYCRSGGLVAVNFDYPSDRATVGSSFEVKMSTTAVKKVVQAILQVDGVDAKTWSDKPFETNLSLSDGPHKLKVRVTDKDSNTAEKEISIGVNVPWDWAPSPTPTATPIPTATIVPTAVPALSPVPTF